MKSYFMYKVLAWMVKSVADPTILCLFLQEFGLIDKKELAPLQELIESIIVPY